MKKIAIVEDNPDNRLLMEAILDGLFEITSVTNTTRSLRPLLGAGASLCGTSVS